MTKKQEKLVSDNPSAVEIKTLLPVVKLASKVAGIMSFFGSKKATEFKAQTDEIIAQSEILYIPDRFNKMFLDQGWIATNSFSLDVMAKALEHVENNAEHEAEQAIMEWFNEDNIFLFCIKRSRGFHDASLRNDQLEEALKLYLEERYIAAVPLILIACDGMVADVADFSPFKSGADLSCFDSIVGHKSALPKLLGKMIVGVKKSTNEPLRMLNRNGIYTVVASVTPIKNSVQKPGCCI